MKAKIKVNNIPNAPLPPTYPSYEMLRPHVMQPLNLPKEKSLSYRKKEVTDDR